MMEWQPIETAPEERDVLISGWNDDTPNSGRWVALSIFDLINMKWMNPEKTSTFYPPTHWMPLPEPPK
jgi:hypothetical protein